MTLEEAKRLTKERALIEQLSLERACIRSLVRAKEPDVHLVESIQRAIEGQKQTQ